MQKSQLGHFIVLEGIDGTGSTSMVGEVARQLGMRGYDVIQTREPSTGRVGPILREFLKDPRSVPFCDALLFVADRIDHINTEILPHLREGCIVVCDRYISSTIAYQTPQILQYVRDMGGRLTSIFPDAKSVMEWLWSLHMMPVFPEPTVDILLDCDPRISLKRKYDGVGDEKVENVPFLDEVRTVYLDIYKARLGQAQVVDASKPYEVVREKIFCIVDDYFESSA